MEIEFEIEPSPIVDVLVIPGRQGPEGLPGPNVVTDATQTNLSGVLVAENGKLRDAEPGEVVSASDMQAAIDEFLDEIDGGSPDTEYSHDEIDGGEPW